MFYDKERLGAHHTHLVEPDSPPRRILSAPKAPRPKALAKHQTHPKTVIIDNENNKTVPEGVHQAADEKPRLPSMLPERHDLRSPPSYPSVRIQ